MDQAINKTNRRTATRLTAMSRNPSINWKPGETASVDPPAQANGAMAERAPDDSATGGSGLNRRGTDSGMKRKEEEF